MDILTLLGWLIATVLIIGSIMMTTDPATGDISFVADKIGDFWDPASVAIVLGGTICALMVSFPFSMFKNIPKHLKMLILPKKYKPLDYIEQIVNFAKEARSNGLLALENKLNEIEDPFLKNSLLMVVDSVDPEKVVTLLSAELEHMEERHYKSMSFYLKGSDYSPAFGMIGTLIGLINLLGNLSDTESLASNMAVALVTTFYGSLISNLIFKPIASKLKARHEEEYLCKIIVSEGVRAIQDGDNPNFIQEKLLRLMEEGTAKKMSSSSE